MRKTISLAIAILLIFASVVFWQSSIQSNPSYNGSTAGCGGGGCHTYKNGIVQAVYIGNNQYQVTVTGTSSKISAELVDASNNVVDYIDVTNSNPCILTAPSAGTYTVNAGYKNPSREWGTDSNIPLPVELASFKAMVRDDIVQLHWKTSTESNNYGFEVERAFQQPADWSGLGFVPGNNTTTSSHTYSFEDRSVDKPGNYYYRLKQIDYDGDFEYSDVVEVSVNPTTFALHQNYPNPFNPSTEITFSTPQDGKILLEVYDLLGQKVATLVNGQLTAGFHSVTFDASQLPSGLYFYKIQANGFQSTKKMSLLK